MAVNKFDSPAQDRYQNTYVPLPYEQLIGTVVARQAQLDKEQAMLEKTYEDTQNIKYIPGSKDEQYVRDYLGNTSKLVDKYYGADLSDPIVKHQLRSEFNKMTDKQTIQNIQSSHAAWAQNQAYKAKLKAEGLYDPAIDEDPANGYDTRSSTGVYSHITSPYKNPRPAGETYFNNMKPSDLGISDGYTWQGITKNDINRVADAKWGEFANTSEGNLYVKKIAKERGLDYTDPKVKQDIATEYLKGIGEEYTFRDRTSAVPQDRATGRRGSGSDSMPQYTPTVTVSARAEGVLGENTKYTAKHVFQKQADLDLQAKTLEQTIADMTARDPKDSRLPQAQLQLQQVRDRKEIIDNNIAGPTAFWKTEMQPKYDELENKLASDAAKEPIAVFGSKPKIHSVEEIKKKFGEFDFINTDVGSLSGIPNFVRNYYEKLKEVDSELKSKVAEDVEAGGIKSISGKRMLTLPLGVDDTDNVYYLDQDNKKQYASSSSFIRYMKENPEAINMVQETAADKKNQKDKNKEIEDLQLEVRNSSKFIPTSYSPTRNADGSFDVVFTTKYKNKNTGSDVTSRTIKTRLTDETQIRAFATDIKNAGHPIEANMILDPSMSNDIKQRQPQKVGESITVTPYEGWYPYQIRKVNNGWEVLDESGNKVKTGDQEIPTLPSIEDAIHYMYQVRDFVHNKQQAVNTQ